MIFMGRNVAIALGVGLLLMTTSAGAADANPRVVIFNGVATEVANAPMTSKDLWISPEDLTKATRFEIKPEGICAAALCYPIPEDRKNEFLATRDGHSWFNLSEFGRLLHLPAANDTKHGVWFFGPRPEEQNSYLKSLMAPNFTLPDVDGKEHSLKDFRGKKVLLLTWASW
jgi:hypothetical protein